MSENQTRNEKIKDIKFNMYKALKTTTSNIELALIRSDNTDEQIQQLNSQLQTCKEQMKTYTPEEIKEFDQMLKK